MKGFKLKLLIVLAGFAYLTIITMEFTQSDLSGEFRKGAEAATTDGNLYVGYFDISNQNDFFCQDSIYNRVSKQKEELKLMRVEVKSSIYEPSLILGYQILEVLSALLCGFCLLAFPFKFFKFITKSYKGMIFEINTIKNLDYMGILLVVLFLGEIFFNFCHIKIRMIIFDFENCSIVKEESEPIIFLFGVVCMVVAAMLRKAVVMKKENELTI